MNKRLKKDWEKIVIDMIGQNTDSDVRSFFMQQLGYIGGEATLDALSKYLTDDKLYDPAVRAMYMISPEKSAEIFASKLGEAKGRPLIDLIDKIGNSGQAEYAKELTVLYTGAGTDVQKAIVAALPKLTNDVSLAFLKKQAASAG